MIKQAKLKQRSIVVTLLDLKNVFGEVHHNIILVVLKYHHVPEEIVNIVNSLYVQFHTTVTTSNFSTEFLPVSKGVLQEDCLSPLLFNLLFNTFMQYIKSKKFQQMGYSFSKVMAHSCGLSLASIRPSLYRAVRVVIAINYMARDHFSNSYY